MSTISPMQSLLQELKPFSHYDLKSNSMDRGQTLFKVHNLTIDFYRTPLKTELIEAGYKYAQSINLTKQINDMFDGHAINNTEKRAAHHTALRSQNGEGLHQTEAQEALAKTCEIAEQIRQKQWLGANDKPITDVVNIGIGGSDLGPRLVCTALQSNQPSINIHFVANIDPAELAEVLNGCSAETTLFIIASKSFNTIETLENAKQARKWLLENIKEESLNKHLIAISANVEKARLFGISSKNILPMWDWVGGRYSLWSAIGLPIAIALGETGFKQLLSGAEAMDNHFKTTPFNKNIPCLMALLEIFYTNILNFQSLAIIPYSHKLRLLPDYLQQLCMESNGKSVSQEGHPVQHATNPVIWGSAGTIGQHSFHQLLHQGTQTIPVDFILPLTNEYKEEKDDRHLHLIANCLAQSKALCEGKTEQKAYEEMLNAGMDEKSAKALSSHKAIPGNRPHTLIGLNSLNPATLGSLIALYEHKTFVCSIFWGINAFDQWGVELGKQLSMPIADALISETPDKIDSMTDDWIKRFKEQN